MEVDQILAVLVEAAIFLAISAAVSLVVAMVFPRVRATTKTLWRVVMTGVVSGFVCAELWAQLARAERLGSMAIIICVGGAMLGAGVLAVSGSRSED